MRAKTKTKKLEPLSVMLTGVLDRLGLSSQLAEYRAVTSWSKAVGEQIGKHTQAEWIDKGELIVKVDSHVWIQELTFLKPEIIKRLNLELGRETVKDIRFSLMRRRSDSS